MADDEIEVTYDISGVSIDEEKPTFCNNFSLYLYPKIDEIENTDVFAQTNDIEFTQEEITTYSLDTNNGKIKIDTTRRLIKYLKAYVKKHIKDYTATVNSIVNAKFGEVESLIDGKASSNHTHNISDVNSLSGEIESINNDIGEKVSQKDFNSHADNRNNPHVVTLAQLGLDTSVEHVKLHSKIHLYKNMNMVSLHFEDWTINTPMRNEYRNINLVLDIDYKPPYNVYIDDVVVSGQHIVIGSDGKMWVFAKSDTFHGQASWIVP